MAISNKNRPKANNEAQIKLIAKLLEAYQFPGNGWIIVSDREEELLNELADAGWKFYFNISICTNTLECQLSKTNLLSARKATKGLPGGRL